MNFCELCGTLLTVSASSAQCPCCFNQIVYSAQQITSEKTITQQSAAIIIQSETRPVIDEICEKCGHEKAFFEARQMRSADEGQTVFFECCKCSFKSKQNT
ncbi:DNA-directed RNA polymerase subunit [Spironucleus salmonicida]|uniref:DNA-directed RNA polymerase subunit n=1 Tax=Spironucleus salmonicida TaxID=348837 RepID=V6LVB2_9EUKA|nr:DNA-directed RNA polymerase subunit [Spironucleus salmonicida]|eukprot:EST48158.1 DNA-directed RNA polymerase subunit [Spironucleus salmonicida]